MATEHALLFISDSPAGHSNVLMEALCRRYRCARQSSKTFADIRGAAASQWLGVVIDSDLNDAKAIEHIKRGLQQFDRNGCFVVVVVDPYGLVDVKMAMLLHADRVIPRMAVNVGNAFAGSEVQSVVEVSRTDFVRNSIEAIEWLVVKFSQPNTLTMALNAAEAALDSVFRLARAKTPIDGPKLGEQSQILLAGIDQHGLQRWLDLVRRHHNGTYRHSLAVAGIAGAFVRRLGFARQDAERLILAALLHDVGKAEVPVDILEKTSELTPVELEILRRHPVRGREMVEAQGGIDIDILDVISDHHECLDGSGYPRGLRGDEIGDLTRLMTICDCFANLISRRPPGTPNTNHEAFEIMQTLGARLDMTLVHVFGDVIAVLEAVEYRDQALN